MLSHCTPVLASPYLTSARWFGACCSELGKLGGGASCEVFSGHLYGLFVAVKRLGDGADAWEGEQFQSELDLLCNARHANLCRLFSYSLEPRLCLVLELCGGGALDNRLACGADQMHPPLTWDHRLRIAVGICSGLAYLHSMTPQMLHRDVKSANILLDDQGIAKVAGALIVRMELLLTVVASDFGTVHIGVGENTSRTHLYTRKVVGTRL